MMAESMDETHQQMLSMFLCDMAAPLGVIHGYAELLEDYLEQLADQAQVATVILDPDLQMTPQEALEMVRNLLKNVEKLDALRHKTHDDIRNLYSQE